MKNYTITATDSMEDRSNGLYNIAYDGSGNYVTLVGGVGGVKITTSYNGGAAVQRHANSTETNDTGTVRYFGGKWHIQYFWFNGATLTYQYSTSTDGTTWTSVLTATPVGTYTAFKSVDIGLIDGVICLVWSIYKSGSWELSILDYLGNIVTAGVSEWGQELFGGGFDNGSYYTIFKANAAYDYFTVRKFNYVGSVASYTDVCRTKNFSFTAASSTVPLYLIKHTPYTWFLLDRYNDEVWLIKDQGYQWFCTKILTKMACITFDEAYLPTHITCLNTTTTRNVYKIAYGGGLIKCPTIATTYTASALPYGSQVGVGLEFLANDVAIATYGFATYTDLKVVNWDNNYDALDRIPHLRVQNVEKITLSGDQILADDADRIGFMGFKERSKENVDEFAIIYYKAYIVNDLNRAINYHGNTTWANILIDIIQRNCLYLDPTSIASSATTFNVTYKYQILSSILNDTQKGDAKYVTIDPDGVVRLNDGSVASGVTLTSVGILANDTLEATISRVILNNIVAATSDTIVGGDYIDFYPAIQDIPQLEAIALNILDAQSLQKITLLIDSAAVPYLGKTYTLTVTELGITAEEWICYGYSFNYPEGKMNVQFVNALYVEAKADVTLAEQRTSQIIEGQIPAQYLQVEDEGNFKNQYADDWGTSGNPSGWSILPDPETADQFVDIIDLADFGTAVMRLFKTVYGNTTASKSVTAIATGYISFRLRTTVVVNNATTFVAYSGANDVMAFRIYTSLFQVYDYTAATYRTICAAAANTNYHIKIDFDATTDLYSIYINGTYAYSGVPTRAFATIDSVLIQINGTNTDDHYSYFDAFYCGDSWLKAWSSMYDGQVADRARWTRYGERGYHSLQFKDRSVYDWRGISATNADTVVLDLVNGDEESKTGFDGAGESTSNNLAVNLLPSNAVAVDLRIQCSCATANTGNSVTITRNSISNGYQGILAIPQCVANYASSINGIVELASGKLKLTWYSAAGLMTLRFHINGYFI